MEPRFRWEETSKSVQPVLISPIDVSFHKDGVITVGHTLGRGKLTIRSMEGSEGQQCQHFSRLRTNPAHV